MSENNGAFDSLIEQRMTEDAEFQASIENLADDERNPLIEAKKKELVDSEYTSLKEKADKAAKNEELANNYKVRAEKAEKGNKIPKIDPENNNLSSKDLYALMEAKVPQEDIDEVIEVAKLRNVSVAEALKSNLVKAVLTEKAEFRKTAAATSTRTTRQTTKVDATAIISDIKDKGEDAVPTKGSTEAEEVFWARRGGRR